MWKVGSRIQGKVDSAECQQGGVQAASAGCGTGGVPQAHPGTHPTLFLLRVPLCARLLNTSLKLPPKICFLQVVQEVAREQQLHLGLASSREGCRVTEDAHLPQKCKDRLQGHT